MADPFRGSAVRQVRLPGCLFPALLGLFFLMPLAELAILLWSARNIGFWWTLLACIATAVAGSALARWQGARVLRAAQESLARGEMPADAILDGVCLLVGGVLLLTPGFLTDVFGFVLLLPPSRALLKAGIRRWWQRQGGVIDVRPES